MSRSYQTLGGYRIRSREILRVAVSNRYCSSTEFHQKLPKPPVGVVLDFLRHEIAFSADFHHPNVMASHSYESHPYPHIVIRNGALGEPLFLKPHVRIRSAVLSAIVTTTAEVFERFYAHKVPAGRQRVHRPVEFHRMVVSDDGALRLADLGMAVVPEGEVQRLARTRLWGFDFDTISYRVANEAADVLALCKLALALLPQTLVYAEHPLPRVIDRACSYDPDRRIETFAELRDAVLEAKAPAQAAELRALANILRIQGSDAGEPGVTADVTSTRVQRAARADDPEATVKG